jgi:hypothetical protein
MSSGVAQACRFDSAHGRERQPKGFPRSAAFQWAVCASAADLKSRSALPPMLSLIGGRY